MKRVAVERFGLLNRRRLFWSGASIAVLASFLFWQKGPSRPEPNASEKAALAALEADYQLESYELDDQGHVIKLKLDGSRFNDGAIAHACRLTRLQDLSLINASITDAGVKQLSELKHLQTLQLLSAGATDKGLGYLAKSRSLHYLWLAKTDKLTSRGIESLKRSVPGLQVFVSERTPRKLGPAHFNPIFLLSRPR